MKMNYAWRSTGWLLVLCLMTLALLASCGGNKGLNVGGDGQQVSDTAGGAVEGSALTITEDEIGSLPAWQQELLADPGWNQPPIPQRPDTPMPAPSYEMLLEWQQDALANPGAMVPRGTDGKSVSWKEYVPGNSSIQRGEFDINCNPDPNQDVVPYGCESDDCTNGHAMDEKIADEPLPDANRAISYVNLGIASGNHFTGAGGSNNLALCAVYQLWSSTRSGDPTREYYSYNPPGDPRPEFAELSYRADGGPGAGGDPCNAASAYTVEKFIWWKYNMETNALPGGNKTPIYNILIAPSSDAEALSEGSAPNKTIGQIQHFYCGNLGAAYGGGAIVTLDSSQSSCDTFKNGVTDSPLFFTNPIYGVLLKRWEDSVLDSMDAPDNKPWDGEFGWPVQGPVPYNNGAATLTGNGAYYAWGMYFERGFIWWVDYVNNANVPDEAQAYTYTGANVFCKGATDKYEKLPTIYYGGSGALGVSVIVEASLNPSRGPGSPPAGSFYEVGNPEAPEPPLLLDVHAHGYGGEPRASDGAYKHYTWAFRDGTIGVTNGTPYDDSTKYLTHSYATQAVYTIRVQVVDSDDNIGYGDSLPIHVGSGGGGGPGGGGANGQVWLIRMDGGTYNANYNALKDSLTNIGASWTERTFGATTANDFINDATSKVALFYRGGPGAAGENTDTSMWTAQQIAALETILTTGTKRRVVLFSQSHATHSFTSSNWYWQEAYNSSTPLSPNVGTADTNAFNRIMCYGGPTNYITFCSWNGNSSQVYYFAHAFTAPTIDGAFSNASTSAAERYAAAGSSGKVPLTIKISNNRQFTTMGRGSTSLTQRNSGFITGFVGALGAPSGSHGMLSWGCTTATGYPASAPTTGTGRVWTVGYSWNDMSIESSSPPGMTKHELLRNILAWQDSSLTFSANTNQGFQEYGGAPEILSVTPAFWQNQSYTTGGNTTPWNGSAGQYPDQTSTDVYRTSGGLPGAVLTSDPNNNWINGNDVDFQHPLYAYIDDGGNGVEEGAGNVGTTDDTVFYAGLLLSDADNSWDRYTPADTPSIQLKEDQNNTMNRKPVPVTAGYYSSTASGGTADDIYANYGTEPDAFTAVAVDYENSDPLHVEALAHWPQSLKYFNWSGPGGQAPNAPDAYLVWQLYPGQSIKVQTGPDAGKFVGLNVSWNAYLANFDIDPSATVAGRDGTPWNRPAFTFRNDPTQGRAVDFNFRKLKDWNGDLNRDGTIDGEDKFPVRVRLFTNHQAYWNKVVNPAGTPGWPNHLADPGGNPATTPPASRNPSFLEGGTYITDNGTPVYTLQVADDPNQPDPGEPGTLSGQGPGTYTADINFIIKYGSPNYHVDIDTWYTGVFGSNDGVNTVSYSPDFMTEGAKSITIPVPATQQNGYYTFAVRVTDQNTPAASAIHVWPNQVALFPQSVFTEDFDGDTTLANWTLSGDNIGFGDGQPSTGWEWRSVTGALFSWDYWGYGDEVLEPYNGTRFAFFGTGSTTTGYPYYYPQNVYRTMTTTNSYACTNGQSYTITLRTIGSGEYGWDGIVPEISWNNGTSWINSDTMFDGMTYVYGKDYAVDKYGFTDQTDSWTLHTGTLTATGTQFKMRLSFTSDQYIQLSSMGVDDIEVK